MPCCAFRRGLACFAPNWSGAERFAGNTAADNVSAFIDDAIRFTTPSGGFDVAPNPATAKTTGSPAGTGTCNGCFYVRSADVTALVTSGGPGTYAAGRVPATQGATDNSNPAAGWTLAVVYEDFNQPIRSLSLFQGLEKSDGAAAAVSGFCTSPTGPVSGRLAVSAIEGDARTTGDDLRFGPVSPLSAANRLSGPRNPPTNFFSGQILNDQGDVDTSGTFGTFNHTPNEPVVGGRQGWDISNVNVSAQLVNNQTTAFAQGTSSGDGYHIMALALQIDVGAPRFASAGTLSVDRPTASLGDVLTYTVLIDNAASTVDANNVVFFDTPPAGTSFVPNSFAINGTTQPGVSPVAGVPIGTLAAGATMTLSFQARIDSISAGPQSHLRSNRARWTFDYLSCAGQPIQSGANETNTVVTIVPVADLQITKTVLNPAFAGAPVIYQTVATNAGPSNVDGAVVTDNAATPPLTDLTWTCTSPVAGSCSSPSGTGPLSSAIFLPAGAATTFRVTGRLPANTPSGPITNTATVLGPAGVPDLDTANNTAVLTVPISARANLEITKSGPATASRGANVVYTMVVRNRGPSDAENVLVTDPTPPGLTLVSLSGPCTVAPGCSLLAGSSETVTATFAVPPAYAGPDPIVNVASVTSATPDPNTTRNTSQATSSLGSPVAAVSIAMTDNVTQVLAGMATTYTITLTNTGPASALDTRVVDAFDPATFASVQWECVASGSSTCSASGSQAGDINTLVNLDPGTANAIVITVHAQVRPDATGTAENIAAVSVAAGVTDPTADDNLATDVDAIRVVADMSIVKTGPPVVVPGTSVDYTIVVTNGGPSTVRDLRFAESPQEGEVLDAGLLRPELIQAIQMPPAVSCIDLSVRTSSGQEVVVPSCTIPVLAPLEARTFIVRLAIPPDYAASQGSPNPSRLSNTAVLLLAEVDDDPDGDDLVAITTATVTPEADVGVSKIGPSAVLAGSVASYFIRVSNTGPSRATNVIVEDPIPPGTTVSAIDGPCSAFPCTIAALDAGGDVSLRVDLDVPIDYAGPETYLNTVTARSEVFDPNPSNGTSSVSTIVLQARADLRLSKTGPSSVVPGEEFHHDIAVSKGPPSVVTDVLTADALPAGTTFVSVTTTGPPTTCAAPPVGAVGVVKCATPMLQPDEVVGIRVVVRADDDLRPGTVLSNVAVASSPLPDFNNANDRAQVDTVIAAPVDADLIVTGSVAAAAAVGMDLTYTLTVVNKGPAAASSVVLATVLPASLTLVSAVASQGTCTVAGCEIGTLAAGAAATVTLIATATTPGVAINEASVTAAVPDPSPGNNRVTLRTTVGSPDQADLVVEIQQAPNLLYAGQTSGYIIRVTNRGPAPAVNVQLQDQLPLGFVFLSNGGACTTAFPCDFETLQPGESRTVNTVFRVPADFPTPGNVTNAASVSSDTPDPDASNNSASVVQAMFARGDADLEVNVTDSPDAVSPGGSLSYAIVIVNHGPATLPAATVTTIVPSGLANVTVSTNHGTCTGLSPIACELPELSAGSYVVVQVLANAPVAAPTPNPMVTTATVTGGAPDPNPANNTAAQPTTVLPVVTGLADLAVTLAGPDSAVPGQDVVYSIAVTNLGPNVATGVQVAGSVSAGLTFVSASAPCAGGFPCSLGTLAVGGSVTVHATFHVPGTYRAPAIVSVASVGSATGDPSTANNAATTVTGIRRSVALPRCDLNGDGFDELVAGAGPGGGPHVRAVSLAGASPAEIASFYAYTPQFDGGVFVACGDVNGDGLDDIVTGAGAGGGPHVRAFSVVGGSVREIASFYAFNPQFGGGVRMAVGDVDGDGVADIIAGAGPSGGPHVRAFSLAAGGPVEVAGFYAYDPSFAGGVYVAAGDVDGDGVAEIVTGATRAGGPVRVFTITSAGVAELASFFPYSPAFMGQVRVGTADIDGDGAADIITGAGPGGGPHVQVFSVKGVVLTVLASFYAYDPGYCDVDPASDTCGGVFVAGSNLFGDGRAELVTGTNRDGGPVRVFSVEPAGAVERLSFFPYFSLFRGPVHVASAEPPTRNQRGHDPWTDDRLAVVRVLWVRREIGRRVTRSRRR